MWPLVPSCVTVVHVTWALGITAGCPASGVSQAAFVGQSELSGEGDYVPDLSEGPLTSQASHYLQGYCFIHRLLEILLENAGYSRTKQYVDSSLGRRGWTLARDNIAPVCPLL